MLRDALTLSRKDLLLELRRREVVLGMLQFVVATLVLVHFGLGADQRNTAERAAGMLWIAIVFTAVLALNRAFAADTEDGALDAVLLAPVDRGAIWLGKALAQLAFLAVMELIALPLYWLFFFQSGGPDAPTLIAAVVLFDLGIVAVGVLASALAGATRSRDVLLPVLLLPLAIPLVIAAGAATVEAFAPGGGDALRPLGFLVLSDTVFALLAWGTFGYLVGE